MRCDWQVMSLYKTKASGVRYQTLTLCIIHFFILISDI
ncbi:Uncharacterized protein dnm_066180 [Desulfonema magnum]|uniref:Uncharacterized protein n=1 Tax=Desulfonema magnum TaxID=45655 RepID=A0A975BSF2_9BACT|nr:Uncharacterized protein dnm_066180 [Desulfonema magnum]